MIPILFKSKSRSILQIDHRFIYYGKYNNQVVVIYLIRKSTLLLSQGDFFAVCCDLAVECGLFATVVPYKIEVLRGCKMWGFQI